VYDPKALIAWDGGEAVGYIGYAVLIIAGTKTGGKDTLELGCVVPEKSQG
jgi:hypothetical protein